MQMAVLPAKQMGTDRVADVFFDFASPFSYLAMCRLPGIAEQHQYRLVYHTVDVTEAKVKAGNYGPSNREVPAKLAALTSDLKRWAQRLDVPIKFPPRYQCEVWNIGCLLARDSGIEREYTREVYSRIWGQGIDPEDSNQLLEVSKTLGWPASQLKDFVESAEARERYLVECQQAYVEGVFGAPIVRIGQEVWWGNDRLSFVERWMSRC